MASSRALQGTRVSLKLLNHPSSTESFCHAAHSNLVYYVKSIGGHTVKSLPEQFSPGWFYTTPTFLDPGTIVYRLVNYKLFESGPHQTTDPSGVVKTQNLWDGKGTLQVEDSPDLKSTQVKQVQGLEDLRLTKHSGVVCGLAATWEYCKRDYGVVQTLVTVDEATLATRVIGVLSDGSPAEKTGALLVQYHLTCHPYLSLFTTGTPTSQYSSLEPIKQTLALSLLLVSKARHCYGMQGAPQTPNTVVGSTGQLYTRSLTVGRL